MSLPLRNGCAVVVSTFLGEGEGCHIRDGGFVRGSMCLAAAEEEEEEEGMSHTMKALRRLCVGPGRRVDVGTIK